MKNNEHKVRKLPHRQVLLVEILRALLAATEPLRGSEIDQAVAESLRLSPEDRQIIHRGKRTKIAYELAWARTTAKDAGYIHQPVKGRWAIVPSARSFITEKVTSASTDRITK